MSVLAASPPGIPAPPQTSQIAQQRIADHAKDSGRTAAWQRAVDQADSPHVGDLIEPRTLAAVIGALWFALALRRQWRSRRRAR